MNKNKNKNNIEFLVIADPDANTRVHPLTGGGMAKQLKHNTQGCGVTPIHFSFIIFIKTIFS